MGEKADFIFLSDLQRKSGAVVFCRVLSDKVFIHIFKRYMNGVQEVKGSNPFGPIFFSRWERGG
jgi:hypothetical protein